MPRRATRLAIMPAMLALIAAALSACASGGGSTGGGPTGGGGTYVGGAVGLECAPFARALTGVRLSGAAASWWSQAQGRYARAGTPADGSVLVLRQEPRLPYGHVAVVSRVVSSREILVTQANWVHHRVTQDQPVVDVSVANDWTSVQVWWPPAGQLGTHDYPAFGFIRPDRGLSHDAIVAATPGAIRIANGD